MLKKVFITAAAAAALSVPLAGVAWATPENNNPPGHPEPNPITGATPSKPGIPGVVGVVGDAFGTNPNPGQPLPPGEVFSSLKKGVTLADGTVIPPFPGKNTPERYAAAINALTPFDVGETLSPGLGVKSGTPACKSGRTGGNLGLCN